MGNANWTVGGIVATGVLVFMYHGNHQPYLKTGSLVVPRLFVPQEWCRQACTVRLTMQVLLFR